MEYSDYCHYDPQIILEPFDFNSTLYYSVGASLGFTWVYFKGAYGFMRDHKWIDKNLPSKWCWKVEITNLAKFRVQICRESSCDENLDFDLNDPEFTNNIRRWQTRIIKRYATSYINSTNPECQNIWLNSGYIINEIIDLATIKRS